MSRTKFTIMDLTPQATIYSTFKALDKASCQRQNLRHKFKALWQKIILSALARPESKSRPMQSKRALGFSVTGRRPRSRMLGQW
jgi:hypothetical protein